MPNRIAFRQRVINESVRRAPSYRNVTWRANAPPENRPSGPGAPVSMDADTRRSGAAEGSRAAMPMLSATESASPYPHTARRRSAPSNGGSGVSLLRGAILLAVCRAGAQTTPLPSPAFDQCVADAVEGVPTAWSHLGAARKAAIIAATTTAAIAAATASHALAR
jgi:hypothetical protein